MGLATAWALARDGHEVELFEQGPLPNPLASSMDEHRLIRHPYGDHRGLRPDDRRCLCRLGPAVGRSRPASLRAPPARWPSRATARPGQQRSAAVLAGLGKPMTELRLAELPRRFPQLDTQGRRARLLDGQRRRAVRAGHRRAHSPGISRRRPASACIPDTPVRTVDLERARIVVNSAATHDADIVVVAAGAWVGRLLPAGPTPDSVAADRHLLRPAG